MVNPSLVVKVAGLAAALILIPTTTFFVHRYVAQKNFNLKIKTLLEGPSRLPNNVIPLHYEIDIRTDIQNNEFIGFVRIEIECKKPTKTVILHAKQLILKDGMKFYRSDGKKAIKIQKMDYSSNPDENPKSLLILYFKEDLEVNRQYHFEIDFRGRFSFWETGFYLSAAGHRQEIASTQFFPANARRVIPCFDEPSLKAEFTIRLGKDGGLQTVSNMPPSGITRDNLGFQWQRFEKTARISPHHVGFVVGELSSRTDSSPDGRMAVNTWTQSDKIGKAAFVRSIVLNFIRFYEGFFGVSYPIRQLNLVALSDTADQVRENYGLMTLSENYILIEAKASSSDKYNAALVISHELSHQWMGCLATMKWWSDYWVMESFAFFVRSLPIQQYFNEWNSISNEFAKSLTQVLLLDDEDTAEPIYIPDTENMRADELTRFGNYLDYGDITINKGALLFHMLNSFLGESVFKAGVNAYLKNYSYKVSNQLDLWMTFDEVAEGKKVLPSGVMVKHIMEKWIGQPGYPVLTVTSRKGGQLTITQKRYLSVASSKPEVAKQCWWVPVKFYTASKPKTATGSAQWLGCDPNSLTIETGARPDEWILLNRNTGIFRVNYDSQTWDQLLAVLKGKNQMSISEMDRMLLVSDAMALADSGDLSYKNALQVLSSVSEEKNYLPWQSALNQLEELKHKLMRTDKYDSFKKMMKKVLEKIYKVLEKRGSGLNDNEFRTLIQKWACMYDVGDCVKDLMEQFTEWQKNQKKLIDLGEQQLVFCEGVKQGDENVWNKVWEYFHEASLTEKAVVLMALTCTTHQELFSKLLTVTLDRKVSPVVFTMSVYMEGLENREGYATILNFVLNNFHKVKTYFSRNFLKMIFDMFGRLAAKQDDVDKLKEIASKYKQDAEEIGIAEVLKDAELSVAWLKKNLDTVSAVMDAF